MSKTWSGRFGVVAPLEPGWLIKKPSEDGAAELETEKAAYKALQHLQGVIIPQVKAVGHDFLVLQHLQGKTLRELAKDPSISQEEWEAALVKVVEVVALFHNEGWVHNDLHDANVIVGEKAWLIDLNWACRPPNMSERLAKGELGWLANKVLSTLKRCKAEEWKVSAVKRLMTS